ncbi:MAG: DivIVA domain-containing protein [Erysipelotrichaceae bacterium]
MGKVTFDTMRKGYNRYQVDDKLNEMDQELAMLNRKVEMYRERANEASEQLKTIKDKYQFVVEGLSAKEKAADEMAHMATKEANMIVDTANVNADIIVKEALMTARTILLEIAKLGNEAYELKGNMKEQLNALSKALEAFEVPIIPEV